MTEIQQDKELRQRLSQQKDDCANAILVLMRSETGDHFFVRGILERMIEKIEGRLEGTSS